MQFIMHFDTNVEWENRAKNMKTSMEIRNSTIQDSVNLTDTKHIGNVPT